MSEFKNIKVTRSDFDGNNVEIVTYGYAVTTPAVWVPKPPKVIKPLTRREKLAKWRKRKIYSMWHCLHDMAANRVTCDCWDSDYE